MPTGLTYPSAHAYPRRTKLLGGSLLSIFLQPTAGEVLGMSAGATYNDKCRRASVSLSDYDAKLHRRYNVSKNALHD